MLFAVLATGPSLSTTDIEKVRGKCKVVAVSNAYKLAPWADALASTDARWWRYHTDAQNFAGLKFTAAPEFQKIEGVERLADVPSGTNSGLLGIRVAVHLGATKILLLGYDMKDGANHFFGKHPIPLKSSSDQNMERFKRQFLQCRPAGVEIINCTVGSALKTYPFRPLEDCLSESSLLSQ